MFMCMYLDIDICIHIYIYIYMYVCIYIYIYIPAGSLSGVVLCRFFRGFVFLGIGKKLLLARVFDSMCSDLVHGDACLVMMLAL